ncbi:MAG: DUF481 domain-containing protein [Pseudomonadota bacterium]
MKRQILSVIVGVVLSIHCFGALAKAKTDVVTLYNGDRITGEIKSLEYGILKLSTEAMGTISIEWQDIASVDSNYYYEIRITDGSRHLGSMQATDQSGRYKVVDLNGEHLFEALQVVSMRPIEKSFLDRLDAYFSAGYSYTRASSVAQSSLNTSINYEDEKSWNTLTGRISHTNDSEESTSSSRADLNRSVWTSKTNVFRSLFANYETNDELGLDYRYGVGAGRGRVFSDTFRHRLTGVAGLQVITEENKDSGSDQNIELYLSTRFQAWRLNTPELDVDFSLNVYPSLTDSGRVRSGSDLRLRWEIIEDLFFDITAYGSYDNKADSNSGLDYGVTTGVGWEY